MFPVPRNADEMSGVISVAELKSSKDGTPIFPESDFNQLIEIAESSASAVGSRKIKFTDAAKKIANWKIAGLRYDPIATIPQIRLIVQPVTIENGSVTVHEETLHLIYMFPVAKPDAAEADKRPENNPPVRAAFDDLLKIRQFCRDAGVNTAGRLSIHPGLKNQVQGFSGQIVRFLESNLHGTLFNAGAILGLHEGGPQPWIFLAFFRLPDGKFTAIHSPGLGPQSNPPKTAQLISFLPGDKVIEPAPSNTNRSLRPDQRLGVSTERLFDADPRLDEFAIVGVDEKGDPVIDAEMRNKDIPDFVANPQQTDFFDTDCASCHSESTRRAILKLPPSKFAYRQPEGISGLDQEMSPSDRWNVRHFSWFRTESTITQRTANETSEMVKYINENFFKKN
jgi:hypothetical protein